MLRAGHLFRKSFEKLFLLLFIVKHTVTESLEIRVGDLIAELFAHTLGVGSAFATAGAISARLD